MASIAERITHTLYNGEVVIDFYPNSHMYKINGNRIELSVTKVTGIMDKPGLLYWACNCMRDELLAYLRAGQFSEEIIVQATGAHRRVKKEAADVGTIVHDFCEAYALHQMNGAPKPELPTDEKALSGCLAFLRWVKANDVRFVAVENICYSRTHNYVGKFDFEYTFGDSPIIRLADYKTSKDFYPMEMGMQTAAYQHAREEELGKRYAGRDIIRLDKETGMFEVHPLPNFEADRDAFIHALHLIRRKLELEKLYPRQK